MKLKTSLRSHPLAIASLLFVVGTACSGGPPGSAQTQTPEAACSDLCSEAGFSNSNVQVYDHETNCSCSGGSGTVTDAQCSSMCTSIEKDNADTYSSTAGPIDSCQCS